MVLQVVQIHNDPEEAKEQADGAWHPNGRGVKVTFLDTEKAHADLEGNSFARRILDGVVAANEPVIIRFADTFMYPPLFLPEASVWEDCDDDYEKEVWLAREIKELTDDQPEDADLPALRQRLCDAVKARLSRPRCVADDVKEVVEWILKDPDTYYIKQAHSAYYMIAGICSLDEHQVMWDGASPLVIEGILVIDHHTDKPPDFERYD